MKLFSTVFNGIRLENCLFDTLYLTRFGGNINLREGYQLWAVIV